MHKTEMGMTNPFATIYWLAPIMAVVLGIVSLLVEGWIEMFTGSFFEGLKAIQTCGFILLPGSIAFAMVASEY
jgi:solute carrier family 35 protein C2